jgi:hypothetical protein
MSGLSHRSPCFLVFLFAFSCFGGGWCGVVWCGGMGNGRVGEMGRYVCM